MTAGPARDRAADPTVAEALADDGSPIRNMPRDDAIGWLREVATSRCGSQFDARAWAAARVLLSALAGTPHPGVTRLLARCDQADAAARRGNHTPAGGLVPAIEIRALLGHTTTDNAQEGTR